MTVSLRYADLVSVLPTRIRVLAWPSKKSSINAATMNRKENGVLGSHQNPARLSYAEDALRTMSLPEGAYCFQIINIFYNLGLILLIRTRGLLALISFHGKPH